MAKRLNEFLAEKFVARSMIVGRGILPKNGKLFIGGAPKIGKSFLVLNMALDMAIGQPLFGAYYPNETPVFPVYEPQRVLYMENEIGSHKLQERLKTLVEAKKVELELELFIKSRDMLLRLDETDGIERMRAELAEVRPTVLIIDPLAQYHLYDENSAQEMSAIMRVADKMVQDYDTSIIFIHHTGHVNPDPNAIQRKGGARLRGSSALFGAADAVIIVDRTSESFVKEPYYKLSFDLRHNEPLEQIELRKRSNGLIELSENVVDFTSKKARKFDKLFGKE